jgi:hypothetical protein
MRIDHHQLLRARPFLSLRKLMSHFENDTLLLATQASRRDGELLTLNIAGSRRHP